jgi:DNA-binding response OmpR family regulator
VNGSAASPLARAVSMSAVMRAAEAAADVLGVDDDGADLIADLLEVAFRPAPVLPWAMAPQAGRLVATLRAARGRVVTHETLRAVVSRNASTKQVHVVMCQARKALPYPGWIVTEWGVGARWVGPAEGAA